MYMATGSFDSFFHNVQIVALFFSYFHTKAYHPVNGNVYFGSSCKRRKRETDSLTWSSGKYLTHLQRQENDLKIVKVLLTQSCLTLWFHGLWPARLLCSWNSPGKNNGVSSHSLLQGIVPTWGTYMELLHYRQILYHLSHQGNLNWGFTPAARSWVNSTQVYMADN